MGILINHVQDPYKTNNKHVFHGIRKGPPGGFFDRGSIGGPEGLQFGCFGLTHETCWTLDTNPGGSRIFCWARWVLVGLLAHWILVIEDFLAGISTCAHVQFVLEDWVFLNNVFVLTSSLESATCREVTAVGDSSRRWLECSEWVRLVRLSFSQVCLAEKRCIFDIVLV